MLAELGDLGIDLPDGRTYHLRGGHRLWAAPEVPAITYEPDDDPVTTAIGPGGLAVTGPTATGIEKSLDIAMDGGIVTITHRLTNNTDRAVDLAPWAITQFPLGGKALLPMPNTAADANSLQANASIAVWPYTSTDHTSFAISDRLLIVAADRENATKIGTQLDRGWLAYSRDGTVFVKRAVQIEVADYVDFGASAQCYCNADFIELETLGPLVRLSPGRTTNHVETWELHRVDPQTAPHRIPQLLRLDQGVP